MRIQFFLWITLGLVVLSCRDPKPTTPRDPEPGPSGLEPIAKLTPPQPRLEEVQKLIGEKKWEEALTAVEKELAAHQGHPKLLFFQGFVHFNRKDFEKALASFEAVRKQGVVSLELTTGLSETLYHLKRYDESERVLREGMEKFPKAAALWIVLGDIYSVKKDLETAKKMYHEALLRDPENGPALETLALLHVSEKDWARAVEVLTKLAAQAPYRELAHLRLAMVKSHQKNWDEALGHLAEAEKTNPEAVKSLREKILIFRTFSEFEELVRTKKCKEARARLEVIRKEHPGSPTLPKAQELLTRECPR